MQKLFLVIFLTFLLPFVALAQEPNSSVPGLKIPAAQTVNYDQQFIALTAECKGVVKWLVLSTNAKINYKIYPSLPNDIIIGIPPQDTVITVFCNATLDGKITDFVRTDITVKGPKGNTPGPDNPNPPQPPAPVNNGGLTLLLIHDHSQNIDALVNSLNANDVSTKLKNKNISLSQ